MNNKIPSTAKVIIIGGGVVVLQELFSHIPYESGVHYNIDGYKKVAETIHNFDK